MIIANLGCGTKTSNDSRVINVDRSIYLILKKHKYLHRITKAFFNDFRFQLIDTLPENILVHNLSKGIPFDDDNCDVVYHSHVLEHIDRDKVELFLTEAKRVLKPGGIHRIVIPDFEYLCNQYINHIAVCDKSPQLAREHENYIVAMIEQCVRKDSAIAKLQHPIKRSIENLVLGDARRRCETHQWMYDRITLTNILLSTGYKNIKVQSFDSSYISDWNEIGLDLNDKGEAYTQGSLYIEAFKI